MRKLSRIAKARLRQAKQWEALMKRHLNEVTAMLARFDREQHQALKHREKASI